MQRNHRTFHSYTSDGVRMVLRSAQTPAMPGSPTLHHFVSSCPEYCPPPPRSSLGHLCLCAGLRSAASTAELVSVPGRDLGTVEPGTPPRDHRSPAKNYPTPEPSANPYQEEPVVGRKWRGSWGGGLLSAPSKRSRCPKPCTVFITILVLLAVLLIGLTIGHFLAPYVRTMVCLPPPLLSDSLPFPSEKPMLLSAQLLSDEQGLQCAHVLLHTMLICSLDLLTNARMVSHGDLSA